MDFNSILIFSENPEKLVNFYKKVFDMEPGWSGGEFTGFKVGSGFITFGPHDKVRGMNKNPERIIINFTVDDVEEEYKRIKDLDVQVIAEPYHPDEEEEMWIATFADPDGNYFQINTEMKMN